MRFTYTAARAVVAGHSAGSQYTLAIYPQSLVETLKPVREQNIANDGTEENLLFRMDVVWHIQTDWVDVGVPLNLLREFITSVAGGEQFSFDPYAFATSVNPLPAKLEPGSISYNRPSNLEAFDVSFSLRMANAIL